MPTLLARGVKRFRVEFVRETYDEALAVLTAWQALLAGTLEPADLVRKIEAHEQFGVTAGTMRTLGGQP